MKADRTIIAVIAIVLSVALPQGAEAGTKTFDGGGSGGGTTLDLAANWLPDGIPVTTDEVLLDNTSIILPAGLTTANAATFGDMIINSSTLTTISLTGAASRNITLSGGGGSTAAAAAGGAVNDLLLLGGSVNSGTVTIGGGSDAGRLNIALGINGNIDVVNSGATLVISGVISGAFSCTKTGTGTLSLSGANTYTGTTTINAGTLVMSAGSLASTNITLASGVTFDVSALASGFTVVSGRTLACSSTTGAAAVIATGKTLTLASGALATFRANGTGGSVGKISVSGDLALSANAISVNITGSSLASGIYRLMECTGTLSNNGVFGAPVIAGTPLETGYVATILCTTGSCGHVDLVIAYSRFWGGGYDGYDRKAVTNLLLPAYLDAGTMFYIH